MTWLIDTNIISEVRKGIDSLHPRAPDRAAALATWLAQVTDAFGPRILAIDGPTADAWGRLSSIRSLPVIDGLLAATAATHGLTLVTRNTADVEGLGVRLLNPFTPPPP